MRSERIYSPKSAVSLYITLYAYARAKSTETYSLQNVIYYRFS